MKTQNNIVLLEADSNYTILYRSNGSREVSSYHMAWHMERIGEQLSLIRTNRKYCVNLRFLKAFDQDNLKVNEFKIPISRRRKVKVQRQIKTFLAQ